MQDTLWSDPTSSDRTLGIHANQRGDDMVEFGPDRVVEFLEANGLDLIVRAHQCVQRGYGTRPWFQCAPLHLTPLCQTPSAS
eukprot:m.180013 g.180013  ORF g.180013 m.180013 type:complete len:82 (+) comp24546_c0_seq28:2941-3186(+)